MGESGVNNINIQSQNMWTVERGEDETTEKSIIQNRNSSDKLMYFSESKFFDLQRLNSYHERHKDDKNINLS